MEAGGLCYFKISTFVSIWIWFTVHLLWHIKEVYVDRTKTFVSLTFQAIHLEKKTRPRLLGLSFIFADICAPSLIYYDSFLEINKCIWKMSDTCLPLPYLGCLEFWVIVKPEVVRLLRKIVSLCTKSSSFGLKLLVKIPKYESLNNILSYCDTA